MASTLEIRIKPEKADKYAQNPKRFVLPEDYDILIDGQEPAGLRRCVLDWRYNAAPVAKIEIVLDEIKVDSRVIAQHDSFDAHKYSLIELIRVVNDLKNLQWPDGRI